MPYQGHYDGGGERDEQALLWIEDVTGRDHGSDSVQVALQDGVALCELAQLLVPGSIGKVSHSKMPFPQRENIAQFVAFCRDIGVPEYELFSTADLFEAKNMDQVVNCLWSLGQVAYKVASYEGPCLGPPPNGGGRRRHHTLTSKADTLAGKPGSGRSAAPIGGSGPAPGLDIRDTQTNAHKIRVTESRGTAALRQLQGRRSGAAHVADPDATGFRAKVQPRRDRLGGGPSQRPAKVAVTKKKGPPAIPHRSSAPPPIPHSSGSSASVSATHERRAQRALHEYLHSQGAEGDQLYDAYGELDALERLKQDHTQRTKTQETLHDVEQLQHLKQQGGTHGELLSVRDHIAQLRQEMGLETSSPSVVSPPAPAAEEVSAAADRAFEALVAQNPGATVIRDLAPPPGAGAGAEASSKYGLSGSLVSQGRGTVGQLAAREAEGILAQQDAARVQAVRGGLLRERQQSATARPRKPSLVELAAETPEHVPHHVDDNELTHAPNTKRQEVAEGVYLYTTQSRGSPPLIVTYRVATDVPEPTTLHLSFADSVNIELIPGEGRQLLGAEALEVHCTLPPYSNPTLVCSVRQADKMEVAKVGMSMDIAFHGEEH